MINISTIGLTLETVGTIGLGVVVLAVHRRVLKEQTISKNVIKEMKAEQFTGVISILFIILGYVLQIYH